ncbi:hypothetical protein [Streptomyces massasporeus]|uniref:hypothetical protein n=1 Tax=Streptomyces massasporeus TaxID=67324 RepID=UPI0036FB1C0C
MAVRRDGPAAAAWRQQSGSGGLGAAVPDSVGVGLIAAGRDGPARTPSDGGRPAADLGWG